MARVGSRTGHLRHYIEIFSPSYSADASGQEKPTGSSEGNCWANIEPMGGTEGQADKSTEALARYKVTLRYDTRWSNLDESWWFTYDGRTFNIVSAYKGNEWDQWIELQCSEAKT